MIQFIHFKSHQPYIVDTYYPAVDHDAALDPHHVLVKEEDHIPAALPVEEFLSGHLGIIFALEKKEIID